MKIKNYGQFLNENIESNSNFNDIMDIISTLSTDEILNFRDELKEITPLLKENINEGKIQDYLITLKSKFRKWFNDRLFNYLINKKKDFYTKLLDKLNIFDLTNLDDVHKSFPAFKLNSIYLAGGMDAAKKGGKVGWRNLVEYQLEMKIKNKSTLPEMNIYLGPEGDDIRVVNPSFTIDGPLLDFFIENPKKCLKLYDKPALLNPVRKEQDRNKLDWDRYFDTLRDSDAPKESVEAAMNFFKRTFNDSIVYFDELIINKVDAIFLGLNTTAGAGTYAEMELLSFVEKPLFTALVEDSENKVKMFKLWNYPQLCKLARNHEEMEILVETLYKDSN